jgi:hypothetical protein
VADAVLVMDALFWQEWATEQSFHDKTVLHQSLPAGLKDDVAIALPNAACTFGPVDSSRTTEAAA